MSGYKDCPNCGGRNLRELNKCLPDDGDPRASNVLFIECRTCGYATLPRLWNTTPKHITLERAERAETLLSERDYQLACAMETINELNRKNQVNNSDKSKAKELADMMGSEINNAEYHMNQGEIAEGDDHNQRAMTNFLQGSLYMLLAFGRVIQSALEESGKEQ